MKKGDLLVEFMDDVISREVQLLQGALERANAQLNWAQHEAATHDQLARNNATSRNKLLDVQTRLAIATADASMAEASLRKISAISARYNLYAPDNGTMSEPLVDEGAFLEAKVKGGLIARLARFDVMRVRFEVSHAVIALWFHQEEVDRLIMHAGMNVRLHLPDGTHYNKLGELDGFSFESNPGATVAFAVVPNSGTTLLPGMRVGVEVCGRRQ